MNRTPSWTWREFPSPKALAEALAARVTDELRKAVTARGTALLVVSGGTTPRRFFRALAEESLPWKQVVVTLADERFVDPSAGRSNEKMVRENLMCGEAARATFVGVHTNVNDVEEAARLANARLAALPLPIDAAVLGMGLDGHTASFFPDAENLAALLDPRSQEIVMPVHAVSAGEPRLTLSLSRLVEAGFVALHVEGKAKRDFLLSILRRADGGPPVRAVFIHSAHPVQIFWAPNEDEIS